MTKETKKELTAEQKEIEALKAELAKKEAELEAATAKPKSKEVKPTGDLYLRETRHGNESGVDEKFVNPKASDGLKKALKDEGWLPEAEYKKAKKAA